MIGSRHLSRSVTWCHGVLFRQVQLRDALGDGVEWIREWSEDGSRSLGNGPWTDRTDILNRPLICQNCHSSIGSFDWSTLIWSYWPIWLINEYLAGSSPLLAKLIYIIFNSSTDWGLGNYGKGMYWPILIFYPILFPCHHVFSVAKEKVEQQHQKQLSKVTLSSWEHQQYHISFPCAQSILFCDPHSCHLNDLQWPVVLISFLTLIF